MCYCSNDLPFDSCCALYILNKENPATAEQLMRSRYSAYVIRNAEYIFDTYAKEKQKDHSLEDISTFAEFASFVKLEVIDIGNDATFDYVEFKAHYLADGKHCQIHEKSRFIKEVGRFKYLDGDLFDVPDVKLSRNDSCPCGSGKKFKKCHALLSC